jgi:hypothetical protein
MGRVIAAILGAIGKFLLKKAPSEGAKRVIKEEIKQEAKEALKDEIKDLSQAMINEAFEAVKGVVEEAGQEMKKEANRKASELRVIATGSPNPTAPRQPDFRDYYQRKIPFRPVICKLLCFADKNPVLGKRRLPAPQAGADEEIKYRVLELRQLAAAIAFDLLDHAIDHKSFIKSEVAFRRDGSAYMDGLQPKRLGQTYWRKPRGSVSPDIAIVENRFEPPSRSNLFAVVDFKFRNDRIDSVQIQRYDLTFTKPKVSIIRMPEDCPPCESLEKKKTGEHGSGKGKRRK